MFRWSRAEHLVSWILLLVLVGQGMAGAQSTDSKSPAVRAEDIDGGRQLVRAYCTRCHGLDATGARAPDLTQRVLRHGNSDEALTRIVENGIPGTGMAGFGWWPEKHVRQVVAFLQHQRSSHEPPVLTGDVQQGEAVFEKHKCANCHWTGPSGGRRGPDLSVSRGRLEYVRQAIVDPGTDVDREYQQIVGNQNRPYTARHAPE